MGTLLENQYTFVIHIAGLFSEIEMFEIKLDRK
jgi:hypothetical protein